MTDQSNDRRQEFARRLKALLAEPTSVRCVSAQNIARHAEGLVFPA